MFARKCHHTIHVFKRGNLQNIAHRNRSFRQCTTNTTNVTHSQIHRFTDNILCLHPKNIGNQVRQRTFRTKGTHIGSTLAQYRAHHGIDLLFIRSQKIPGFLRDRCIERRSDLITLSANTFYLKVLCRNPQRSRTQSQ